MPYINLHINTWFITAILSVTFLLIFALGEWFYHQHKVKAELTRKFVHFSSGVLTLTFPLFLDSHWQAMALCGSFALLLVLSMAFNFLQSINNVDRITWGSYLFPVSVYICFLAWMEYRNLFLFYAPMLVLAISDPLAALFGKKWPMGKYKLLFETKTLVGSFTFFVSAFAVVFALQWYFFPFAMLNVKIAGALFTALVATVAEAISQRGTDNLLIPLSILTLYYFGN